MYRGELSTEWISFSAGISTRADYGVYRLGVETGMLTRRFEGRRVDLEGRIQRRALYHKVLCCPYTTSLPCFVKALRLRWSSSAKCSLNTSKMLHLANQVKLRKLYTPWADAYFRSPI
jgi:hypothetical protein